MDRTIQLQRKLAPDLISVIEERYNILRQIRHAGPIGRRALALMLGAGERVVRAQVDFLKSAGLVEFSAVGMTVTQEGQTILDELAGYVRQLHGLAMLEKDLAACLGIEKVIVIPGDSDCDQAVAREMGQAAVKVLAALLEPNMTIAVSGGSMMAKVAEAINFTMPQVTVVPARGGLGRQVEHQANIIAAVMGTKLGGKYRLLHVPDGMSEEAMAMILANDAGAADIAQRIKQADVLLYGLGRADEMAEKRHLEPELVTGILNRGAVGEAYGHYYTLDGQCVHVTNSAGLKQADLAAIKNVIAVAGGARKAEAIVAVVRAGGQDVLITDEAAAERIHDICKTGRCTPSAEG